MFVEIIIRDVDKSNWEDVTDLELEATQEAFVASNAYSLAEAAYEEFCTPKAIYYGELLIGFSMYESLESENLPNEYMICRLMIDKDFQKKGYGRAALKKIISIISNIRDCEKIKICYDPKNPVAKRFYSSFGFVEVGIEDGEIIAEIDVVKTPKAFNAGMHNKPL